MSTTPYTQRYVVTYTLEPDMAEPTQGRQHAQRSHALATPRAADRSCTPPWHPNALATPPACAGAASLGHLGRRDVVQRDRHHLGHEEVEELVVEEVDATLRARFRRGRLKRLDC